MTRVKRGDNARKRHQKKIKIAKGFRGSSSILFKNANQQFLKGFSCAFVDRRLKKRYFRKLWINRINAKARTLGLNYNGFISKHKTINRKIFAQLALFDPSIFK